MPNRNILLALLVLIAAAFLSINVFFDNQQGLPSNTEKPPVGTGAPIAEPPSTPAGDIGGSDEVGQSPGGGSLQAEIQQRYTERLQSVGSSYEARINSLLSSAALEYQKAREVDPKADIAPLADKYISAGRALEAECDEKMYAIMNEFENELRANSLPVEAAHQARATYEATKSTRASQLLPR